MNRLHTLYRESIVPALQDSLGISNRLALPRLQKIVVNAGLSKSISDSGYTDVAVDVLARITGQQPVKTKAKQSISNFKVREGMVVGAKVTLRGELMYAFLDKLISVALPRVRDFRGLSRKAFDGHGNYSIGFPEHVMFPEISSDEIDSLVGFEINIVTSATTDDQARTLLELFGFPFEKSTQPKR